MVIIREMLSQVLRENGRTQVINPVTEDYFEIERTEPSHIRVEKNGKLLIDQTTEGVVAALLAGTYQDFIYQTADYLRAVQAGKYWGFFAKDGKDVDIGFDRDAWYVIKDGARVFDSENIEEMSDYIRRNLLPVIVFEPFYTLYDFRILDATTAAERWGIDPSRIRQSIDRFPRGTIRKFGKQWVVMVEGMYHVFGPPRVKDEETE